VCTYRNGPEPCDPADDEVIFTDCDGVEFGDCTCEHEAQTTCDEILGSWSTDTYCDDGAYGVNLNCAAFNFDGGACGGGVPDVPDPDDYDYEYDYNVDVVFTDCAGTGFTEELCDETGGAYASTCEGLLSFATDQYCDDGNYGVDFNCEAFGFDSGACGTPDGEFRTSPGGRGLKGSAGERVRDTTSRGLEKRGGLRAERPRPARACAKGRGSARTWGPSRVD
jgi:hypothetical protein